MRILIVAAPNRYSSFGYLGEVSENEYILLGSEKRDEHERRKHELSIDYKEVYCWDEFVTPGQLLKKTRPDKIIFSEIIDLREIALIIAASAKKIRTFYLEHGAAGSAQTAIERWDEFDFKGDKLKYLFNRIKNSFWSIIKSKVFYYMVVRGFKSPRSYWTYLTLPVKMLFAAPNKVLTFNKFGERVPDYNIVFSRANLEEFAVYNDVPESRALLTGIPFFDRYFSSNPVEKDHLVYIDSPLYEERILGWTAEYHAAIAKKLFDFAVKRRIKLYVKLHPKSNKAVWESYDYDPQWISILQDEDCTTLFLESKLILGYSSSLMTAFLCAHKNMVLLGWHPQPQIFGMDFSATGLCHRSLSIADLDTSFDFWCANNLSGQEEQYKAFLYQCNEPFDGKATQRVIDAIQTL